MHHLGVHADKKVQHLSHLQCQYVVIRPDSRSCTASESKRMEKTRLPANRSVLVFKATCNFMVIVLGRM